MIVVDTQAVIWLTEEPTRLSKAAQRALSEERTSGRLTIADISLNEIAMAVSRKRLRVSTTLETYLEFIESRFTVLPVTAKIAARAMLFGPAYPKDPADRLIGATAVVHGARLVTSDLTIRESDEVACIW